MSIFILGERQVAGRGILQRRVERGEIERVVGEVPYFLECAVADVHSSTPRGSRSGRILPSIHRGR
jgi:hypothetical protein